MWEEICWKCSSQEKDQRAKRRYLCVVKEDMQEVGTREDEVFDRNVWRIDCVFFLSVSYG